MKNSPIIPVADGRYEYAACPKTPTITSYPSRAGGSLADERAWDRTIARAFADGLCLAGDCDVPDETYRSGVEVWYLERVEVHELREAAFDLQDRLRLLPPNPRSARQEELLAFADALVQEAMFQ